MLKFFRKIRQNLLSEGKTRTYLKYAVGEIVLVVIGILIALQINNWNEWKKERQKEEKILIQIKNNITESIALWERLVSVSNDFCRHYEVVLAAKQNNLPYHDSLKIHFRRASFLGYNWTTQHSTSSFEALKNIGFDIIQNDTLSNLIIDVFDKHIIQVQDKYLLEYSTKNTITNEYLESNIRDLEADFSSDDYAALLRDTYYYNILRRRDDFRKLYIQFLTESHIPAMQMAVKLIDEELARIR